MQRNVYRNPEYVCWEPWYVHTAAAYAIPPSSALHRSNLFTLYARQLPAGNRKRVSSTPHPGFAGSGVASWQPVSLTDISDALFQYCLTTNIIQRLQRQHHRTLTPILLEHKITGIINIIFCCILLAYFTLQVCHVLFIMHSTIVMSLYSP